MTTALLLGAWLVVTVAAVPLTPWIASKAVQVEFFLGLDRHPPKPSDDDPKGPE